MTIADITMFGKASQSMYQAIDAGGSGCQLLGELVNGSIIAEVKQHELCPGA
jgi:hypothetical protein